MKILGARRYYCSVPRKLAPCFALQGVGDMLVRGIVGDKKKCTAPRVALLSKVFTGPVSGD